MIYIYTHTHIRTYMSYACAWLLDYYTPLIYNVYVYIYISVYIYLSQYIYRHNNYYHYTNSYSYIISS